MRLIRVLLPIMLIACIMTTENVVSATTSEHQLELGNDEAAVSFLGLPRGEATLLQSNEDTFSLINTGHKKSREELRQNLKGFDVEYIDKIFLTSMSDGHAGNLNWLVEHYDVGTIVTIPDIKANYCNETPIHYCFMIYPWRKGEVVTVDGFKFKQIKGPSSNISVTYGDHVLMFLNHNHSITTAPFKNLDHVDALKLGDYGSKSLSTNVIESLDPDMAILFHEKNRLLRESLIDNLENSFIDIYMPFEIGTVTMEMSPDDYVILLY